VSNQRHTGLYKNIANRDLLLKAYTNLKSRPGSMTPGTDEQTLDGINVKYINNLEESLKTEKFQFTSVKRVYIPKSNGKMRPLGIPNIRDRIVQEAMRIILNEIYDHRFSNLSHGFRPNRSCHTALNEISK
jgi:retron-type reverse transcriptase